MLLRRRRSPALVLALALWVSSALAGCIIDSSTSNERPPVVEWGSRPPPSGGAGSGAGDDDAYWAGPGAAHVSKGLIEARGYEARSPSLRPLVELEELAWLPPAPRAHATAFEPGSPARVVVEDALVGGERGTVVAEFGDGVVFRPSAGERVEPVLERLVAEGGVVRGEVRGEPRGFVPGLPVASSDRVYDPGLTFAEPFTLEATNVTFYDARGNATSLGAFASLGGGGRALWTGPFGGDVAPEIALPGEAEVAWRDWVRVEAVDAEGVVLVNATGHPFRAGTGAFEWRGTGTLLLQSEGARSRLDGLFGEVVDVVLDGKPKLASSLVALPERLEVSGKPGEVAQLNILLVESSGGAHAHLRAHAVEGGLEVRYKDHEPMQVTNALLDLARDVADPESPAEAVVTVAALVGIGVALPFVAIAEAFAEFFRALFPPTMEGLVVGAGEAEVATFAVRIPEAATTGAILVRGANFPAQRVEVVVTPTGESG